MTELLALAATVLVKAAVAGVAGAVAVFVHKHTQNAAVEAAVAQVTDHAQTAVLATAQTIIGPAKASTLDGTPVGQFSDFVGQTAKTQAVDFVQNAISDATTQVLEKMLGGAMSVRTFIEHKVEAQVALAKVPEVVAQVTAQATQAAQGAAGVVNAGLAAAGL